MNRYLILAQFLLGLFVGVLRHDLSFGEGVVRDACNFARSLQRIL